MQNTNTVLINTKANPTRAIQRYALISKLGFPTGVRCWCGQELNFEVHERDLQKKRRAFFDQHDECHAPKETK